MRLFVKKALYRAFPELDAFSDERCQRFVAAAKRSLGVRLRMLAAGLFAFLLCVVLVVLLLSLIPRSRDPRPVDPPSLRTLIAFVTLVLGLFVGGAAGLVAKDLVLRRRIRYVLRAKGHCHSCGYLLAGVAVSPSCDIACPECGFVTSVDPALGELAPDDGGRTFYTPTQASLYSGPRWLTPARRARIRKWSKRVAIIAPILVVTLAGGYEALLRVQASAASKARLGPAGFRALQLANLPAGVAPDAPNSWEAFATTRAEMLTLEAAATTPPLLDPQGRAVRVDYSGIGLEPRPGTPPEEVQEIEAGQRYAREVLDKLETSTLFNDLTEMVSCPRHMLEFTWSTENPSMSMLLPQLSEARYLARLLAGRMVVAKEQNNPARLGQSLRIILGLTHMCRTQPSVISWLVGEAVEALAWSRVRSVLMARPSAAWLDAIEPLAWNETHDTTTIALALEAERLGLIDTICWAFEDPSRSRFGRFSKDISAFTLAEGSELKRLGFFWENIAMANRLAREATEASRLTPPQRKANPFVPTQTSLLIPWAIGGTSPNILTAGVHQQLELAGVLAMIRIERYRLETGFYPPSLQAVADRSPHPLPVDPYSGKPLGYTLVDPGIDPLGRGYILYSVGADGVDNAGAFSDTGKLSAARVPSGFDFIINYKPR